jgi:BirA family biotin operon repressor/biotin-[acetyl-CoA-carboxylase] ligase
VLQPSRPFEDLPLYTILTAVSVRKAIERTTGIVPKIKWVNDIYIGNKKVCGILSEGVANPSKQTFDKIVIGIGLNFSMSSFPEEIQHKATSLFPDGHPTISRETLVGEIVRTFFEYENKDFLTDYKAHSFVLGKTVQFVKNGNFYEGKATDISPSGELIVDIGDGLISLNSGEISLTSIEF